MSKAKAKGKGRIMLTWCDNGLVDGKFTEGLVYSLLTSNLPIVNAGRTQGNQIARQRQAAFDMWYGGDTEWILWVDSDIVLTNEALDKVWAVADPVTRPAVSGTYFISKENEQALMQPFPSLFMAKPDDKYVMSYIHPLPKDEVIQVDYAGFGFFLLHRSAADKMREFHGDKSFFMETSDGNDDKFIGEDIHFFMKMKEAGIPLYAHTGATVKHMKRFSYDAEFYKLYWITQSVAQMKEKKAEA